MRLVLAVLALCGSAAIGICQTAGESGLRVSIDVRAHPEPVGDAVPAFRMDVVSRDNFHLFENGTQQDIRYFSAQDAPAFIGIVFDASRSMKPTIGQARKRSVPGDEYFLIVFNNHPQLLSNFGDGVKGLERQVLAIRPDGWTALLDSVSLALNTRKHARDERKAFIAIIG